MRLVNRTIARNLLLFVGAFYLSVLLGMPFFFGFYRLVGGRSYEGPFASALSAFFLALPVIPQDAIAALLAGSLVECSAIRRWAYGFGLFLFCVHTLSSEWHVPPSLADRLHVLPAHLLPALIAIPVFMFAARRFGSARGAA